MEGASQLPRFISNAAGFTPDLKGLLLLWHTQKFWWLPSPSWALVPAGREPRIVFTSICWSPWPARQSTMTPACGYLEENSSHNMGKAAGPGGGKVALSGWYFGNSFLRWDVSMQLIRSWREDIEGSAVTWAWLCQLNYLWASGKRVKSLWVLSAPPAEGAGSSSPHLCLCPSLWPHPCSLLHLRTCLCLWEVTVDSSPSHLSHMPFA